MLITKYTAKGDNTEAMARAEQLAMSAKSLDELQRAQTVILTVGHKLTLKEAAKVIGRSPSWVAHARRAFIESGVTSRSHDHGGRRNQILSETEEDSFMDEACRRYVQIGRAPPSHHERGDLQIHRIVRRMLEERSGRSIPNSTAFALMSRVGKRKFKNYSARQWDTYTRNKYILS